MGSWPCVGTATPARIVEQSTVLMNGRKGVPMIHRPHDGADIYTVKPFGALAALVDCRTLENALYLHLHLSRYPAAGQTELIPAARTVLVRFSTYDYTAAFLAAPDLPPVIGHVRAHGRTVTIPVIYDGQDLSDLAAHLGMSEQALIYTHTTGRWSVAFAGFAPGFFYLHRNDKVLDVPRRARPRTCVPAGSVGLAGDFSGIYPRSSPGGWQLIGHTNAPLWDLAQNPPALLEPGMQVQFEAVRELITVAGRSPAEEHPGKPALSELAAGLKVRSPGMLTLFQDAGRSDLSHWGVSPSGPVDRAAAAEANRLVGNQLQATVLENLAGGLALTAHRDVVLALTGAQLPARISEDNPVDAESPTQEEPLAVTSYRPFALKPGQTLTLGATERGLRTYLAVRGGFAAPQQATSSSRDTLAGLGPEPLAPGDLLALAAESSALVGNPVPPLPLPGEQILTIRAVPGPRQDWFTPESLTRFTEAIWEISQSSDRIGARLVLSEPEGGGERPEPTEVLARLSDKELPSEGMVAGAMQVPPSGEPVIFLADHPVTGGYPVIATVHPDDLRLIAQAPPGTKLQFCLVPFDHLTPQK
ncbi:carboxyltransferase domain-containing protein [Rothia sp. CCM 9416]|uniref:5-oxoprolinase subunit B/C family protein n=1 Tax=Rothia sp. CCM 9416 TaxID=3402655 RepID=UPI003AEDD194